MGDKTDCCPYEVSTSTTTTTVTGTTTATATDNPGTVTVTSNPGPATVTQIQGGGGTITTELVFPSADQASTATLAECPDDYATISSVCCPS
jgi:hypothetical protein